MGAFFYPIFTTRDWVMMFHIPLYRRWKGTTSPSPLSLFFSTELCIVSNFSSSSVQCAKAKKNICNFLYSVNLPKRIRLDFPSVTSPASLPLLRLWHRPPPFADDGGGQPHPGHPAVHPHPRGRWGAACLWGKESRAGGERGAGQPPAQCQLWVLFACSFLKALS